MSMERWLLRGLVLAVVHAAAAVIAAKMAPTIGGQRSVLVSVTFAVLIGIAVLWGALDGWRRSPSPYLTWTIASVLAGLVSGVLNVIGRGLFVDATGISELGSQMTSGAAFVALLVAVPAWAGVLFGSRLDAPAARKTKASGDGTKTDEGAVKDDQPKPSPKPKR